MLGWTTGPLTATGALNTAGADMSVPQGEPLWNQFRHRPQPALAATKTSRIVSFLMVRFSVTVASCGGRRRVGGGMCVRLRRANAGGKQLYPTGDDVQTQRVNFFCNQRPTCT
jgi:hypothetical protein